MFQKPQMSTKLTRRGYTVRKDELTTTQIETIRNDLFVIPVNPVRDKLLRERKRWDPNAADVADDGFKVYRENAAKFYLPKFYGVSMFGRAAKDELQNLGTPIDLLFHGSLRAPQLEVANKTIQHLHTCGGGLLQLRCGFGKTIIALYLITQLKVKALILVHKEFLMNQWKERIEQFLPDASVGTLQAKVMDVDGRDIVIGMLQSVSVGKYPEAIYNDFGICCFDECHHLGAAVFSKSLDVTRTKFMLGLSATPNRKDGLRKVFDWHLGEVICKVEAKVTQHVYVRTEEFNDPDVHVGPNGAIIMKIKGRSTIFEEKPTFRSKLLTYLVESVPRLTAIVNLIMEYVSDSSRRILVLSERRKHLEAIGLLLEKANVEHGYYWGGVKQADLDAAAKKQVLLGTFHMASEGMDVDALNTVVLASPKSDIQQAVGRILRRTDHNVVPTVIDFVDASFPCLKRLLRIRKTFYEKSGFSYSAVKEAHAETDARCDAIEDAPSSSNTQRGFLMFRS
jgi:superfamily II DNA or RNA helicase